MTHVLEKIAEESGSTKVSERRGYSAESSVGSRSYSTFAEMYLEKPIDLGVAGITPTICTWRGVPTIDDW